MYYYNNSDTVDLFPNNTEKIMSERKIIHDHDFLTYAKNRTSAILNTLGYVSFSIPPNMGIKEYRALMSLMYTSRFKKSFPELQEIIGAKGFDMLYKGTERVSYKSMNGLFQPAKKNGKPGEPKEIVLTNTLGTNKHLTNNFDWLFACQRGLDIESGRIHVGFGIASYAKVESLYTYNEKSDQIKVKIQDRQWDYFSEVYDIKLPVELISRTNKFFDGILNQLTSGLEAIANEYELQYI